MTTTTEELVARYRREREHYAYLAAHSAEIDPETTKKCRNLGSERMTGAEIASSDVPCPPTPEEVEAAARELYGSHPFAPQWDGLPNDFKEGMRRRARDILKAALEVGQ